MEENKLMRTSKRKWLGRDGAFFGEGFTKLELIDLAIGAVITLILTLTGVFH